MLGRVIHSKPPDKAASQQTTAWESSQNYLAPNQAIPRLPEPSPIPRSEAKIDWKRVVGQDRHDSRQNPLRLRLAYVTLVAEVPR